ncbi:MAG: phasin, partial [Rhodoblastus sp.]
KPVEIKTAAPKPAAPKAAAPKPAAPKPAASEPVASKPVASKPADAPIKAVPVTAVDMSGVQDNLRKAASKTLEQGRAAFERMKEASEEATETIEASFTASSKGASELASKALEVARINANATFDHLKALAGAKTLADAVTMHGQFIRAQSEAAIAQAKEFAELAKKAATDAAAPIQAQIKKAQAK